MSKEQHRVRRRSEFDHTGDLGIAVEAESMVGLLEEAALGMFGLLTDLDYVSPEQSYSVTATGHDRETLLLNWLSELNYLHLTDRLLFCRFAITELTPEGVTATAFGEPIDPSRHSIYTEIKAVTYHDLTVEQRNGRWYARIIFDI
jgi:SHS2 domain-containing protein